MRTQTLKAGLFFGAFFLIGIPFLLSAQNDSANNDRVYIIVPQMPTFQGDLDNYMGNHLQYPHSAIDKGIQGTVNITFVVSKTGDVRNVTVLSGVSPELDSEAVRVVSNMPPWNPGMKNGKAVNVQYNLPVYFELNNTQKQLPPAPDKRQVGRQNFDTTFILRDGLYVDPYFGYGEGGPQSSAATSTSPDVTMSGSLKFGVGISYILPSNIGISIGLQIQQYNFNYTYSNIIGASAYNGTVTENRTVTNDTTVTAGYNETIKYSFMYAQLPILCRYISSQENKPGFYAEAGILINYLVSSNISGNATQTQYQLSQAANTYWYMYNTTSTSTATVNLTTGNPAKLTFSLHALAGVIIPFNDKISLILGISPDCAFMNAGDGSKDIVNFGTSKFYLYGSGTYGSFNSYTFDAKLLIKMFGSSEVVHRN